MASTKRIGFYWGEDKITVVEFEKNAPLQVVYSPLGAKTTGSPFSSNLTEEIQITVILKKLLDDNQISGGAIYVSLPMKEIILRSFVIPYVKAEDIQNAVKFEAKKYIPFDIQDLSFVFHTIPFTEGSVRRFQVIFFAARREVLARYERIFKQVNAVAAYGEPYIVSLSKTLLYRKEITPTEHIAFLVLDKTLGRICFIDKGIPQFIREFPVGYLSPADGLEIQDITELNGKIVNEVLNSFDFYARQFSGERIDQLLVSSEIVQKDLVATLENELKLKIIKFSPQINAGSRGTSSDMDAIYAMGACVSPPMDSLSKFNFLSDTAPKEGGDGDVMEALGPYMDMIVTFLICGVFLIGAFVFFQMQLKIVRDQYNKLALQEGSHVTDSQGSLQGDVDDNTDKLAKYKDIRTKSDLAHLILELASHFPVGSLVTSLTINYDDNDSVKAHLSIDLSGEARKEDANKQIEIINQIVADFKNDKQLTGIVSKVDLLTINQKSEDGRQSTGFTIHFS